MDHNVTVIIPAYNEEESIGQVVSCIRGLYPDFGIVVIDDGSEDRTADISQAAGAYVIRHPYNKGNGAAVKTGIRHAKSEIVVLMDADGQHDPSSIAEMLKFLPMYDLVVGARVAGAGTTLYRRPVNALYNLLGTYVSGQKILDLTSGFRIFKRAVILPYLGLLPNSFSYPATSTLALIRAGYSVKFFPIRSQSQRRLGQSKIHPIRDGLRFFFVITRISILFAPFRIFLPISLSCLLAGILYGGYTALSEQRFTNFAQLLIILGILVFMLGLIADQIASLRFTLTELREKPKIEQNYEG